MIKYVFFDLDGTLLPMDQDVFLKGYFKGLSARLAPYGYDPKELIDAVWEGTIAMIKNDGRATNEEVFWEKFEELMGKGSRKDESVFEAYYREDFPKVKELCGFNLASAELIAKLKEMGIKCVLATNPIFPYIATEQRIGWAGLKPEDFEIVTTYENSSHCKPFPGYFTDLLSELNADPSECVMVGNDVGDDMSARKVGMRVFLLKDCLINRKNEDIEDYPQGGFKELTEYLIKEYER